MTQQQLADKLSGQCKDNFQMGKQRKDIRISQMVKLYPQGNAEARFKMNGVKKIYLYCNRSGLFCLDVVKGIDDRRNGYDDTEERRNRM